MWKMGRWSERMENLFQQKGQESEEERQTLLMVMFGVWTMDINIE